MTIENDGEPPCGRYTILSEELINEFKDAVKDVVVDVFEEQISLFPENFTDDKVAAILTDYSQIKKAVLAKGTPAAGIIKISGEIFPSDVTPVICISPSDPSKRDAFPMKWGYTAEWSKTGILINAVSEKVTSTKTFAESVLERRCVIPAMGYYEWKVVPGNSRKQKNYIIVKGDQLIYFAGIYKEFYDPKLGCNVPCYVIMTRTPTNEIKDIHDRMPLILPKDRVNEWLYCGNHPSHINDFILSVEDPAMLARPVLLKRAG